MRLLIRSAISAIIFLMVLSIMPSASAGQGDARYSEAQMLLFANEHLRKIGVEAMLHYDFLQSGSATDKIDDQVTLKITAISEHDGRDVQSVFLSGENNRPYTEVKDFRANPLIMLFLQWDSEKMEDAGEGSHHYFRKIIVNAFHDKAQTESVTLQHGKANIEGKRITLKPFNTDKNSRKQLHFLDKQYEFTVSDAIPGGIYSIKTTMPGNVSRDKASEYTEMIFNRIEPKTAFSNKDVIIDTKGKK